MRLLILGGTGFLGPHVVDAARARGWEVSLFNRGRSAPGKFPDLTTYLGDRDPQKGEGLKALERAVADGARWDAVVDTSAYVPRIARASAELLAPAIHQYVLVSTVSVYGNEFPAFATEETPVATIADPTQERVTGESYGPLKALCEDAVRAVMPTGATIVRPGLIVGPGDPTDRFTYWPVRISRGGAVLIPQSPRPEDALVSFIDVRDLAQFIVRLAADGHDGTYNATGPAGPLSFDEMVDGCKACTSEPVEFVRASESFLLEQRVGPWMELPLWIPIDPEQPGPSAMGTLSRAKAMAAGLSFRPLAETATDTTRWFREARGADADFTKGAGLPRDREQALIAAWRALQTSTAAS